jgi:hypothetical protein
LDDWKRNLAREARPTIDLILIRNQLTCIEKGKPKNNNKIRQHEEQTHLSIPPLLFPYPAPFLLKQLPLQLPSPSILITTSDACGLPSSLPPQQPAAKAVPAAILHDLANI